eukprot:6634403-Pyramimonas_sp.AAC.1
MNNKQNGGGGEASLSWRWHHSHKYFEVKQREKPGGPSLCYCELKCRAHDSIKTPPKLRQE